MQVRSTNTVTNLKKGRKTLVQPGNTTLHCNAFISIVEQYKEKALLLRDSFKNYLCTFCRKFCKGRINYNIDSTKKFTFFLFYKILGFGSE